MSISANQLDALQELVNIGVGRAASVLNEMLDAHIRLQVPYIKVLSPQEASKELEQQIGSTHVSAMRLAFTGALGGTALLIFPLDSAAKLVAVLMHEETDLPDLDAVKRGTLSEVGNILLNSVMGNVSNVLEQSLRYSIPFYFEETVNNLLRSTDVIDQSTILLARTHLACDLLQITGDVILIFTVHSFDTLLLALTLI